MILLSGDRQIEVEHLAGLVGIKEVYFGKFPEEKVALVGDETKRAKTLFVGDGINDAPAMLTATVGIALGQNSDVTSEAAQAIVLDSSLRKVDELIHIARRCSLDRSIKRSRRHTHWLLRNADRGIWLAAAHRRSNYTGGNRPGICVERTAGHDSATVTERFLRELD